MRLPLVGGRKQILLSHMFGQKQEYTKEFSHIQTQTTSKPVRNQKNIEHVVGKVGPGIAGCANILFKL